MVAGRPREHDREKIAEELIEWAKLDDSWNFNGFCCSHEPCLSPQYILRWANEDTQFRVAYEKAKAFIAERREKKLSKGDLHAKAYDLNATVYDQFHAHDKREEKKFENSLKDNKLEEMGGQLVSVLDKLDTLESKT